MGARAEEEEEEEREGDILKLKVKDPPVYRR